MTTRGDPMSDDDSTSDESNVALLFNKSDAGVKAGMAVDSSDDDDDTTPGIHLYSAGMDQDEEQEAAMQRAARARKRRLTKATTLNNSDDEDFVPKSQMKQPPIVSLLKENDDDAVDLCKDELSSDEDTPRANPMKNGNFMPSTALTGVLNPETSRKLMELKSSSQKNNQYASRAIVDVDNDLSSSIPTSTYRYIKVNIEGTDKSISLTCQESTSVKELMVLCLQKFQLEPNTPIALYYDNQILGKTELLFDYPVQFQIFAKVHKLHTVAKEAPKKGILMKLTLRGPSGEKEIEIGSLQPLRVALEQYGVGSKLKFDGEVLDLDQRPGVFDLEDEDLIDVEV